ERPADRGAELDELEGACGADELDDPAAEQRVDVDLLDRGLEVGDRGLGDDRTETLERVAAELALDDRELLVEVGVPERRAQEEPVELRLRQRERALLLDRVLRRQQEER